jgi:hypothetical protein
VLLPTAEITARRPMAKVLVYNNFLQEGQDSPLVPKEGPLHEYRSVGPGWWRVNPYSKSKHMGLRDFLHKAISCTILYLRWLRYDVLIADSAVTGLALSAISLLHKGRRKLVISSFNVPRHRHGFWKWAAGALFRRIDRFIVHSTHDIELCGQLYGIPASRFTFIPFFRGEPATGEPDPAHLREDVPCLIVSLGGNARDYGTFFHALARTDLHATVVAREYNLKGLGIPPNVKTFCNLPLDECDRLVRKCRFTVFTFDGSEPSCGQTSIVTSFMAGKPVICTDWIGVRDYVIEGVNGLLVKKGDPDDLRSKMVRLSRDRQLYDRLSVGAATWVAQNIARSAVHAKVDSLVTELVSGAEGETQ